MYKINFFISILIILTALILSILELTNKESIWSSSILYAFILILVGEFIAYTTSINIQNRIFVRDSQEAIENALPKIPFKVKKAFKFLFINFILLLIIIPTSYFFIQDEPLKSFWYIILFFPMIIHFIGLIIFFLFINKDIINSKKKIYDDEDRYMTIVQIGKKLANKNSLSCRKTNTQEYQTLLYYLKNGQNPDEIFENKYTLLLPASCCGDVKLVKSLLEYKSDVNFKSPLGKTALILASAHGFDEIVSLLVENRANIKEKDFDSNTALFYAKQNNHEKIIEILETKN